MASAFVGGVGLIPYAALSAGAFGNPRQKLGTQD